jgi:hypothetical protein
LNPYPPIDTADASLLRRAAEYTLYQTLEDLCGAYRSFESDLDFVTALFHDRVLRVPENLAFRHRLQTTADCPEIRETLFGIVPGAFYRNHRNTGADGARLIEILSGLGACSEVIPVKSFGRVYENAQILLDWLRTRKAKHVALISLSKGSADVKTALQMDVGAMWDRVGAWISLSGLTEGTPLIAWLRRQPLRMLGVRVLLSLRGQKFSAADDLRHGPDNPLMRWPTLPTHLQVVHVIAFPTRRHLHHQWAFRGYERLAALGPNDGGGILLRDVAKMQGVICPVWATDHYLQPAWDSTEFLRRVMVSAVRGNVLRQTTASAAMPRTAPASRSSA